MNGQNARSGQNIRPTQTGQNATNAPSDRTTPITRDTARLSANHASPPHKPATEGRNICRMNVQKTAMTHRQKHNRSLIALLAPLALLGTQPLHAGSTSVITGFDYSTGRYGDADSTTMMWIPVTVKYRSLPWTAKVTLPWISITGPESVTAGSGAPIADSSIDNSGDGSIQTDSGMGDVTASLGYALDTLWSDRPSTFVDLTAKVKLPTADEKARLGTGKTDYQLLLDIAHTTGSLTPFVTLGYKWMGDTAEVRYNDVASLSLGADKKLRESLGTGLIYQYVEAVTHKAEPRRELMAYLNWKASHRLSLNFYGVAGFSDSSPDQSIGLQLVFRKP